MAIAGWRHQIEAFSVLLVLCEGNPPVTGGLPSQRPVTRSFDVFFSLNKRQSKQSRRLWFDTPSRSLRRHCNSIHAMASLWSTLIFTGGAPRLEIRGLDSPITIGRQGVISCHIEYYWTETAHLVWHLGATKLPNKGLKIVQHENIANYSSEVDYIFTQNNDMSTLKCVFSLNTSHRSYEDMASDTIRFQCE